MCSDFEEVFLSIFNRLSNPTKTHYIFLIKQVTTIFYIQVVQNVNQPLELINKSKAYNPHFFKTTINILPECILFSMSASPNPNPEIPQPALNQVTTTEQRAHHSKQPDLISLTWPIMIENLLRVSLSSVDVFMLSFYSEKAVAAVGLINQFVFFIILLYLMISVGSSILIAQNLGAKKHREAQLISLASISLGLLFSIVLSISVCIFCDPVLKVYNLEPEVHRYAWQFLMIYGGSSMSVAAGIVLSTILRTHGYSREPMVINIISNIINVIGNYLFIFGPFGIPKLGVVGVALSTVFSQVVGCVLFYYLVKSHKEIELPWRDILKIPRHIYRQILSIGIPSAGENLSYNIGQIVIMRMVASMGTESMAAFVYIFTILRFVFINSISIGNGTQIKVGYYIGAGLFDEAYKKVYRYFAVGFVLSLVLIIVVNIIQIPLMGLFTNNKNILHSISLILLISLALEPARNFNVIIIPALKGAGDVKFPVYIGMIFMWGIGVLGAYVFGILWGWGLVGIWIALAMDEWIRGLIMMLRWKRGAWRSKCLVR
jgi:putative MATE family efflux protein